jgi:hypothetical protein
MCILGMSLMTGMLEAKILIPIVTVLLETKTDSKHFSSIDSGFSYQNKPPKMSLKRIE